MSNLPVRAAVSNAVSPDEDSQTIVRIVSADGERLVMVPPELDEFMDELVAAWNLPPAVRSVLSRDQIEPELIVTPEDFADKVGREGDRLRRRGDPMSVFLADEIDRIKVAIVCTGSLSPAEYRGRMSILNDEAAALDHRHP